MPDLQIDFDRIDEAILALMFLSLHSDGPPPSTWRAWKSFDWSAMDRLHEQDLILSPTGKARSVVLTDEGRRRSQEAFNRLFMKRAGAKARG